MNVGNMLELEFPIMPKYFYLFVAPEQGFLNVKHPSYHIEFLLR
jgi:hypothetical protein